MRGVPRSVVAFVAQHEGCRLKAYQDSAGIWTIGYGHIEGVNQGDTCTVEQATAWLGEELEKAAGRIYTKIGEAVVQRLTSNQFAALISFVYNLGTGNPAKPEWTIWKRLRALQFDQVPAEFMKFVNATDPTTGQLVKVQGLVNRRADEVKLWSTGEPGTSDIDLSSGQTRVTATPPTPQDPHIFGTPVIVAAGAAAATGVNAIGQVTQALQPYATNHHVAQWLATLGTAAAVLTVVGLVVTWLKHKLNRN